RARRTGVDQGARPGRRGTAPPAPRGRLAQGVWQSPRVAVDLRLLHGGGGCERRRIVFPQADQRAVQWAEQDGDWAPRGSSVPVRDGGDELVLDSLRSNRRTARARGRRRPHGRCWVAPE